MTTQELTSESVARYDSGDRVFGMPILEFLTDDYVYCFLKNHKYGFSNMGIWFILII